MMTVQSTSEQTAPVIGHPDTNEVAGTTFADALKMSKRARLFYVAVPHGARNGEWSYVRVSHKEALSFLTGLFRKPEDELRSKLVCMEGNRDPSLFMGSVYEWSK